MSDTEPLPESLAALVRAEEQRDRISKEMYERHMELLETAGLREPEPEPRTAAEAFRRRMAAQVEQERRHEQRVAKVVNENPSPDVADPLRQVAKATVSRHRRRRRRGRVRWFRPS